MNLYKIYISAWSNYEEDKLMDILNKYMRKDLNSIAPEAWYGIKYFYEHFTMKRGDYFGVDSDYAIGDEYGEVVWEGDYPSEQVIKDILNNY